MAHVNHEPLMGIKKITVHYGLESPWACKGPKIRMPHMGRKTSWAIHGPKVKWDGVIFDGPHDVVGPISFRAVSASSTP